VTVDANTPTPGRSRLLYPAFIVSLALNLLFIGGIGAAVWHHSQMQGRHEGGLLSFARELPKDRQDAFREQVSAAREALKSQREEVRAAWLETNALLTTEPFDRDKCLAALTKLREVDARYKTGLSAKFADIAASFSPEERKLLQTWRAKRKARFLKRHDDKSSNSGK
jgi:uncharacterized membrane protein